MQRFTLLLLVASVALFGAVVPVDATRPVKRETNAQRFARHLAPLAPVKRSRTDTAKRSQVLQRQGPLVNTGNLQVQNENGIVLGLVFNAATGPTGINPTSSNPTVPKLVVDFENGNLEAQDPIFASPFYIGAADATLTTTPGPQDQDLILIEFTNVPEGTQSGSQSDIWSLDSTSGELSGKYLTPLGWLANSLLVLNVADAPPATWTNSDQSEVPLTIVYDPSKNTILFTETPGAISDPLIPVSLYLVQAQ